MIRSLVPFAALVLCLGAAWLAARLTLSDSRRGELYIFILTALPLCLLFSRLVHWYFNAEMYRTALAFFDPLEGGFSSVGILPGVLTAVLLMKVFRLTGSASTLLDASVPAMALALAGFRLSERLGAVGDSTRLEVTGFLSHTLLAFRDEAAGGTRTVFAVRTAEALFLILLAVGLVALYRASRRVVPASLFFLGMPLFMLAELLTDALRDDAVLMHFRFFFDLNQYSAFISAAQVSAAVALVLTLLHVTGFIRTRVRRFLWCVPLLWFTVLTGLVMIGWPGEYLLQRTANYPVSLFHFAAGALMIGSACAAAYLIEASEGKKRPS